MADAEGHPWLPLPLPLSQPHLSCSPEGVLRAFLLHTWTISQARAHTPPCPCPCASVHDFSACPSGERCHRTLCTICFLSGNMGSMSSVRTGANMLIPVPGDSLKVKAEDQPGPGGVLVCADSFVTYMHEGHETVQTPIPRRQNLPDKRGILLLASSMHKKSGQFVVLAQSEYGDIYKVSLVNNARQEKMPSNALCGACAVQSLRIW
jgi:hypothetical protein